VDLHKPINTDNDRWIAKSGGKPFAIIILDHISQVRAVVVLKNASAKDKLQLLRLCLSHAMQICINRHHTGVGGKFAQPFGAPKLTHKDSDAYMNLSRLHDEVVAASLPEVKQGLTGWGIPVYDQATSLDFKQVLQDVAKNTPLKPHGVSLSVAHSYLHYGEVMVKASTTDKFFFWSNKAPAQENPGKKGFQRGLEINGATDIVLTRGTPFIRLSAPEGASKDRKWTRMTAPSCAECQSFTVVVDEPFVLGNPDSLVKPLKAALMLDKTYIEVWQYNTR